MKKDYKIEINKKLINQASIVSVKDVKTILSRHNINFWLDQGTLLGAIRDNDFIPWDWDIDLCTWKSEFKLKDKLWDEFREAGYHVFFLNKSQSVRLEKKHPTVGWRHVDIHFYDVRDDTAISYFYTFKENTMGKFFFRLIVFISLVHELKSGPNISLKAIANHLDGITGNYGTIVLPGLTSRFSSISQRLAKILSWLLSEDLIVSLKNIIYQLRLNLCANMLVLKIPYRYFSNLEETDFHGIQVRIPNPVREYLRFRFGDSWQTPRRDWVFYEEDGAIETLKSKRQSSK